MSVRLKKITLFIIITLLFSMSFVLIGNHLSGKEMHTFDVYWIHLIQGHISTQLTSAFIVITFFGSSLGIGMFTAVTVCLLLFVKKFRFAVLVFLSVPIGAALFNWFLKTIYKRDRPTFDQLISQSGYSFPSGHSMGSIIFYGLVAFIIIRSTKGKWINLFTVLISVLIITIIGISRIYLGVHFPSDIVGGYIAGGFWVYISIQIYTLFDKRYSYKK